MENPGNHVASINSLPIMPTGIDRLRPKISPYFTACILLILLFMMGFPPVSFSAEAVAQTADQRHYLAAREALKKGRLSEYRRLKAQLQDYPLLPYLDYSEALKKLGDASVVADFLNQYDGSYLASRLRDKRLRWLGDKHRWGDFLRVYEAKSDKTLRCYYLRAKLSVEGVSESLVHDAREMWMSGSTQPKPCSPVFDQLYKYHKVSKALIWQRIGLAMEKGHISLAKFLAKKLPASERPWVAKWLKAHRKPKAVLSSALRWQDSLHRRQIILHALKRYSREDTPAAWALWKTQFLPRFNFSEEEISQLEDKLVLRAAWRHLPEALDWFSLIPAAGLSEEALEWRVRSAIRSGEWRLALEYLNELPESHQGDHEWTYWRGRTYENLNMAGSARSIFEDLSNETDYYGFLASDRLGIPYTFTNEPVVDKAAAHRVEILAAQPAFQRIYELYKMGLVGQAYSEWRFEIRDMPKSQKRVAARLAYNWKWHFTAIVTTAQAKHFSDLDLRFPLLFERFITREAKRQNLSPSLVYGVIRRESAFRETAVSPAGALGLMQVMPATAKMMTKKLGMKRMNRKQMRQANNNIKLGAGYLRQVLNKYNGHEILATASYNAGPHRVKKWLPEDEVLPADIWIDTITFDETRKYVKAVLFYSTIFDWKLDGRVDHKLNERMKPVQPEQDMSVAVFN